MKKTFAASCSTRKKEVSLGNSRWLRKKKMALGDGVDSTRTRQDKEYDTNSVRQKCRHMSTGKRRYGASWAVARDAKDQPNTWKKVPLGDEVAWM